MQGSEAKRKFWEHHIKQWEESGSSVAAYCDQHSLRWCQLYYWRKKFTGAPKKKNTHSQVRLVPIEPPIRQVLGKQNSGQKPTGLRLTINGASIDLEEGFDRSTLRDVVQILRG